MSNTVATRNQTRNLVVEDARIIFRNFKGEEGRYNKKGDRNFCLILDPDDAMRLRQDGWNIKELRAREEGDEPTPYLQVSMRFDVMPPKLMMITSKGRVDLDEGTCELLDWADIAKVDVIVRPYHWNVNGDSGIKAYLKTIAVTINEDYLELKYADVEYAQVAELAQPLAIDAGQTPNDNVIEGEVVYDSDDD